MITDAGTLPVLLNLSQYLRCGSADSLQQQSDQRPISMRTSFISLGCCGKFLFCGNGKKASVPLPLLLRIKMMICVLIQTHTGCKFTNTLMVWISCMFPMLLYWYTVGIELAALTAQGSLYLCFLPWRLFSRYQFWKRSFGQKLRWV